MAKRSLDMVERQKENFPDETWGNLLLPKDEEV